MFYPDPKYNSCQREEQVLSAEDEDDMIFNEFTAGSLVWARVDGYPWWPAMVDDDPDLEQYYWLDDDFCTVTFYHVVFFDEDAVTRAWVNLKNITSYAKDRNKCKQKMVRGIDFSRRIAVAKEQANDAIPLTSGQRLRVYSFIARYKGPINTSDEQAKKTIRKYKLKTKGSSSNKKTSKKGRNSKEATTKNKPKMPTKQEIVYENYKKRKGDNEPEGKNKVHSKKQKMEFEGKVKVKVDKKSQQIKDQNKLNMIANKSNKHNNNLIKLNPSTNNTQIPNLNKCLIEDNKDSENNISNSDDVPSQTYKGVISDKSNSSNTNSEDCSALKTSQKINICNSNIANEETHFTEVTKQDVDHLNVSNETTQQNNILKSNLANKQSNEEKHFTKVTKQDEYHLKVSTEQSNEISIPIKENLKYEDWNDKESSQKHCDQSESETPSILIENLSQSSRLSDKQSRCLPVASNQITDNTCDIIEPSLVDKQSRCLPRPSNQITDTTCDIIEPSLVDKQSRCLPGLSNQVTDTTCDIIEPSLVDKQSRCLPGLSNQITDTTCDIIEPSLVDKQSRCLLGPSNQNIDNKFDINEPILLDKQSRCLPGPSNQITDDNNTCDIIESSQPLDQEAKLSQTTIADFFAAESEDAVVPEANLSDQSQPFEE